ncbi:DUF1707 domain-containing protein [Actinoplanes sp. N902-109]|uniref:DUF1707 SHOCT-like domain-containing protein n=1 Tax=Actinoplanes sp. (strain N902-109) TaxID=649831 RepID=UPI0005A01F57|nr:DUF1707 domain-containing protein [Actinoplanes sp. N902-109]
MSTRASDEDRQRVLAALERHTGAGRLTLDEFADRAGVAAGATTLAELSAVLSDLPPDHPQRREFLVLLLVAVVTLVLLAGFLALR